MTLPTFGIVFNNIDSDPLPPVNADFSVVGLVLPSDDANPSVFPQDTAVDINSSDTATLAAMGTGPLRKAVDRINAQLAPLQVSARIIVVRVATAYLQDGVTEDVPGTTANIIGNQASNTGYYALLKAGQTLGVTPRLLGSPGYTGWTNYAVASPVITNPGSGYTHPVVTFNPAGATATATAGNVGVQAVAAAAIGNPGTQATAHATLGSGGAAGQVAAIAVDNGGTKYGSAPAVTLSGGGGTGATAHAVLTSGVVTSIVVDTPGTGYTSAPAVSLAAPPTGQVTGIAVSNGGQDYATAPSVTLTGGGGTGATAHAVLTNGIVSAIVVDNPGSGYATAPSVGIGAPLPGEITGITLTSPGNYPAGTNVTLSIADSNGGTGTGATATVSLEQLANPLCAIFPSINAKLLSHALVGGPGGSKTDAIAWKQTLPDDSSLIPQDDFEIVAAGQGTAYIDGVARSLGLAVATDFEHDGLPFWSWANRPIVGALGAKRPDAFSITDGATDGQELLAAGIGIMVRGDLSDTSLDDSGYVAVSINDASSNTLTNFYNKVRGRNYIDLQLMKSIRKRLGVNNISRKGVDAVINDMAVINITLMSKDALLGFRVGFSSPDNTVEGLRAGKFTVSNNTEEAAPITQVTINRAFDRDAVVSELASLVTDTSAVAG